MNIELYIPTVILNMIDEAFFSKHGRPMTSDEMVRFIKNDILEVYREHAGDGLLDALDWVR